MTIERSRIELVLRKIVSTITEIDPKRIGLKTKFVEELGMDSMQALEILAAMEKKFCIIIHESELTKITTLGECVAMTERYLAK